MTPCRLECREEAGRLYRIDPSFAHPASPRWLVVVVVLFHCFVFILFFFFLAVPHGIWDLRSLTRGQTHAPCIGGTQS